MAAIGKDLRAVDEAGIVAGADERNARDLVWLTNAPQWNPRAPAAFAKHATKRPV